MKPYCSPAFFSKGSCGSATALERSILRGVGRAIEDFGLIQDGDRILVAVSGGKDSFTLMRVLDLLRKKAPVSFSLLAVNIDHGFPGYQSKTIESYLQSQGIETYMHRTDIASLLEEKLEPDEQRCSLCARLRRGTLYQLAPKLGCNKIALGHHKDDLIETLLLNLFYTGQLKSMPPKLVSDDGKNIVIRPLAYVDEADIVIYAKKMDFPLVYCSCPASGRLDNRQRRAVKTLLLKLEKDHPGIKSSVLTAMKNVVLSHLMDATCSDSSAPGVPRKS